MDSVDGNGLASDVEAPNLAFTSEADVNTCYRLHGVVNHLGQNAFGGHFLSDILDPEANRWLRCDDSFVTDVSSWIHSLNV